MPRLPTALLLASALVLAACGSGGEDTVVASTTSADPTTTSAGDTAPPPSETGSTPAADVPEELDFVAPDVRGGQVVGSELAGQDLVIWFWAPW